MNKIWSKPFLVFSLLGFLFFALLGQIFNHCHPFNDLGIYSDALRLITWEHLNPYIPGRVIHIFNDHFDPILIPFSFLENWIPAPLLGTTIEWLTIGACWFPIRLLVKHGKINQQTAIFSYAFIVLNHAMTDALFRPFHPTTWACLPLLYTLAYYWLKNFKAMILALLVLFSCREEFPLVGITLGFALILERNLRWSAITLFISLSWTFFAFKVRPMIFQGEFANYGGTLLANFIQDPLAQIKTLFDPGMIRMFLNRVVPLLLLIQFGSLKKHIRHLMLAFLIASPIFAIRFASNSWGFHYGTAPVIALWFMLIPVINDFFENESISRKNLRIKIAWAFILIVFLSPVVKNTWDTWFSRGGYSFGHKQCLDKPDRLREIKNAQEWISKSGHKKILMSSNLVATQMLFKQNASQELYFIGGPYSGKGYQYEVVLAEKPPSGDAWPIGHEQVQNLIETWKNSGLNIITDNEYVFLAEGVIKND